MSNPNSISIPSGMVIYEEPQSFLVTLGRLFSTENSREKLTAFSIKHFTDGLAMFGLSNPEIQEVGALSNSFWQAFSVLEFPRYSLETLSHFYSLLCRNGDHAIDFFKSSAQACATFCLAQDILSRYHFIQPVFANSQSILLWRVFQAVEAFFALLKSSGNFVSLWKESSTPQAAASSSSSSQTTAAVETEPDSVLLLRSGSSFTWTYKSAYVLAEISAQVCAIMIGIIVGSGAVLGIAVNNLSIYHLYSGLIISSVTRNFFEQKVKESAISMTRGNHDFLNTLYIQVQTTVK